MATYFQSVWKFSFHYSPRTEIEDEQGMWEYAGNSLLTSLEAGKNIGNYVLGFSCGFRACRKCEMKAVNVVMIGVCMRVHAVYNEDGTTGIVLW